MSDKLKVTLIKSSIGSNTKQKATLRGLGLRKLNQERVLEKQDCILGMIRKVQHLVKVEVV